MGHQTIKRLIRNSVTPVVAMQNYSTGLFTLQHYHLSQLHKTDKSNTALRHSLRRVHNTAINKFNLLPPPSDENDKQKIQDNLFLLRNEERKLFADYSSAMDLTGKGGFTAEELNWATYFTAVANELEDCFEQRALGKQYERTKDVVFGMTVSRAKVAPGFDSENDGSAAASRKGRRPYT